MLIEELMVIKYFMYEFD